MPLIATLAKTTGWSIRVYVVGSMIDWRFMKVEEIYNKLDELGVSRIGLFDFINLTYVYFAYACLLKIFLERNEL